MPISCEPVRGKATGDGAASGDSQIGVAVLQPGALAFGAPPEAKAMLFRCTVRSKRGVSTRTATRRQRVELAWCQAISPLLGCVRVTRVVLDGLAAL
eukprot:4777225-Pleurochrysis_carterae.AAC.1